MLAKITTAPSGARLGPALDLIAQLAHQLQLDLVVLDHSEEALLATHRGARILKQIGPDERHQILARVARGGSGGMLEVCRINTVDDGSVEVGAFPVPGGVGLLLAGPHYQRVPSCEGLRRLYGLTPTEAKVACALAMGKSPKAIATELGVLLSTVRTHLRAAHIKLGASSQADLIRRLLSSLATYMPTLAPPAAQHATTSRGRGAIAAAKKSAPIP